MPFIKYILSLILIFSLPITAMAQNSFAANGAENADDALQHFRLLLSEQLDPNRATIERVFNPIGEGQSLLVRAYISGPQELVYRPLFDEAEDGSLVSTSTDSFVLRTLPGTDFKEVLINYEAENNHYELFFGGFHYGVSPDMSNVNHISTRIEAAHFLAQNFQTLFIDQPSAALAVRYLFDQQDQEGKQALIQLKKEYKDSSTGALMVNSDGEILNQYRFKMYQSIDVEAVYFIEQYHLDGAGTIRYYIQPDGLQSYHIGEPGEEKTGDWISRQHMQKPRLLQSSETP